MINTATPSGFNPHDLKTWNLYYIPQSDTNSYRHGDVLKSAGGTDANGVVTVTLSNGSGAVRGVLLSVDPGLPATGGLQPGGLLASIPAVKTRDYYVWVADDPTLKFTAVDDGLTPANLVAANVGSYVNFTPGVAAAANGGSTASLTSSTFGGASGAGSCKVLQLYQGSSYGAHATWLLQFAQHELAQGSQPTAVGTGVPIPASGPTTLSAATHNANNLICTGTPNISLPTALSAGFGCSIKGAFALAVGTGLLSIGAGVTDLRTTTGTAWCSLVQTAADGSAYDLIGTK